MYKSLEDIFNSSEAVFNDPLYEIHNPVEKCDYPPEIEEYEEFLNDLNPKAYPNPVIERCHNLINPLHGALRSIYKNNK